MEINTKLHSKLILSYIYIYKCVYLKDVYIYKYEDLGLKNIKEISEHIKRVHIANTITATMSTTVNHKLEQTMANKQPHTSIVANKLFFVVQALVLQQCQPVYVMHWTKLHEVTEITNDSVSHTKTSAQNNMLVTIFFFCVVLIGIVICLCHHSNRPI